MCMCGGCGGGEEVVGVGWEMGRLYFHLRESSFNFALTIYNIMIGSTFLFNYNDTWGHKIMIVVSSFFRE